MWVLERLADALRFAGTMFWTVLWPLTLGFLLSSVVATLVSRDAISRVLGRNSARSATAAAFFGAASSSCSYAAVAVARTLFRSGATLANAIIFEFASTNLVFELGLILIVLMGWQFFTAEVAGGLLMIVLLAILLPVVIRRRVLDEARTQAQRGVHGRMEGHAAMDMSVGGTSFVRRLFSPAGITGISHNFFMDVSSIWSDLVLGFLIAGALAAWVPSDFWKALFLGGHGTLSAIWGALIGPIIAMLSFVCSEGNVPVAAVLWNQGISFGGVIAFIFGDLIIIPILNIYRKYYGWRAALYIGLVSYVTMVVAGFVIQLIFNAARLVPASRHLAVLDTGVSWSVDTVLDIVSLVVIALMAWRFARTGGPRMLRAMEHAPGDHVHHAMHHG